jgi:hypothetical protein
LGRIWHFCPESGFRLGYYYLCLLPSWDYKHTTMTSFLSRLASNRDTSSLYLPSSWVSDISRCSRPYYKLLISTSYYCYFRCRTQRPTKAGNLPTLVVEQDEALRFCWKRSEPNAGVNKPGHLE